MTASKGPLQLATESTPERHDEVAERLRQLGVDAEMINRVVPNSSVDQLDLLEALVLRARPLSSVPVGELMPNSEYRDLLEQLGNEYVASITGVGLARLAEVRADVLRDGVEVLAEMAKMLRAIPPTRRLAMWPSMVREIKDSLPHYSNLRRAIVATGVAGALDAEDHVVLKHLRRDALPPLDLEVLRMTGESDPESALSGLIRAARSAPRTILAGQSVAQLLNESEAHLKKLVPAEPIQPKRWTGWGKLFTGMATAGANIAGGIALGVAGGPLATGVTMGSVIASCAGGIGAICEGVGALRGE